jgi:CDP-diacylglycerol---glycerol-3-phosphate 3-phosphatidyltransferase
MSNLQAADSHESNTAEYLPLLRGELLRLWLAGFVALGIGFGLLGIFWAWFEATQWSLLAALFWWLVYHQAGGLLDFNRRETGSPLYAVLGPANRITLLRGGLIAVTGGFLFQPVAPGLLAWIPGIAYTMAAVIDRLDGYVARRSGQQSLLGGELDVKLDAMGLVIAPLLAYWYGQIHWSYLSVSLAYYLFQWGIRYRTHRELPVFALEQNMSRRAVAGFQMGFIAVVLWPILRPPTTSIAGIAFMLPLLLGFLIDWMTVSGRIGKGRGRTTEIFSAFRQLMQKLLLPSLRIVITVLVALIIVRAPYSYNSISMQLMLIVGMVISSGCILLGIAGRLFALALVSFLGLHFLSQPFTTLDTLLICCVVWTMSLGTGNYSIWSWDESWVNRFDGA